ncbi:hypothetical protein [Pseudomonas sp.]|uniref:hypothetical protein n=1 Tax=Pseudomonas sp. TaxID=306 RepID=UPI00290CA6B5|nr:hypothetical protein [Pseudomonas sp.]MDU4253928.1 hypothetical protein [Pseudomonas sp.]
MSNPPPWGCPWHGLIRSGVLTLPNGSTVAMVQPSNGATSVIRHPVAPGNGGDDTPREDGRQWWPAAILTGLGGSLRLHGRALTPLQWLYIDPAGEVWGVEHTLSPTSYRTGSATFTLRRFGVLGGKSEAFSYTVPVTAAGLGQPEDGVGEFDVASTTFWVRHTNALGSGAIMQLAYAPGARTSLSVGWIEVRLAGSGRACNVSLHVLADRARTMGNDRQSSSSQFQAVYVNEQVEEVDTRTPVPPCTGKYRRTTTYAIGASEPGLARAERKESRYESGREDWIYAMWYDEAGSVQEVKASWGYTAVTTMAEPVATTGSASVSGYDSVLDASGTSCNSSGLIRESLGRFTLSQEGTARLDVWLRLTAPDGTQIEAAQLRQRTWSSSHTYSERIAGGISVWDVAGSITQAESWSGGYHRESTEPSNNPTQTPTGYAGPTIDPWVMGWAMDWPNSSGTYAAISVESIRHSGQWPGIRERRAATDTHRYIITPNGAETLEAINVSQGAALYVSYCPVTRQIARDTVPVCWT